MRCVCWKIFKPGRIHDAATICTCKGFQEGTGHTAHIMYKKEELGDIAVLREKGKDGIAWLLEVVKQFYPDGCTRDLSKLNQKAWC